MPRHSYLKELSLSLRKLIRSQEALSLKGVRIKYLPYFLAFPLAMIFINVENFFLTAFTGIPGLPVHAYAFFAFTVGALTFFVCFRENNAARMSKAAAILACAGLIPWLFLPAGSPSFFFILLLMAGIGGSVSCSSFSFVFVLNNAERFFGCVLMLFVIRLIKLFSLLPQISLFARKLLAFFLVIVLTTALFRYRQEDFPENSVRESSGFRHSIRLTLFLLIAYFAIRITGFYAPAFRYTPPSFLLGALELIPLFLCVALQIILGSNVWTLCNLFFLSALFSYGMWYAGFPEMAHMFSELKEIGFLVVFYLIGCVTNRFCSFRMHKRLIFFCMSVIGILFLGTELLRLFLPGAPVAIVTAAVFFAVFFLLSPVFYRYLFFADWSKELQAVCMRSTQTPRPDQKVLGRQISGLEDTRLTPREKQVALLMLQGMTLRQIASELSLTPSTVATYSKAIYKKLGINSRAELFIRFGSQAGQKNAE